MTTTQTDQLKNLFIIVATARSGSHMLASALDNHPEISCHGEILNPLQEKEQWKEPWEEIQKELLGGGITGFILQVGMKEFLSPEIWEWCKQSAIKKIALTRKDTLAAHLSYKCSLATNRWIANTPEEAASEEKTELILGEYLKYAQEHHYLLEEVATFNPALSVTYEDLTGAWEETTKKILRGLETKPRPIKPRTFKQNRLRTEEKVTNPEILTNPVFLQAQKQTGALPERITFGPGRFQRLLEAAQNAMYEDLKLDWETALRDLSWNKPPDSEGKNWIEILKTPYRVLPKIQSPTGKIRTICTSPLNVLVLKYTTIITLRDIFPCNYYIRSHRGRLLHKPPHMMESRAGLIPPKLEGELYVCDVKQCFPSINIPKVMERITAKLEETNTKLPEEILRIIGPSLQGNHPEKGLPIGDPTDMFFANILLEELDACILEENAAFIRLVDDYRWENKDLCKTVRTRLAMEEKAASLGLELNDQKSGFLSNEGQP
jgi:hypothetical protein